MQRADSADPEVFFLGAANVTLNGFTASLSAATPNAGYQLSYRALVAPAATAPLAQPFDFAVVRYAWTAANGRDLDTRTAITTPPRNQDVGWSRGATDLGGAAAYLQWGGDNTTPTGDEAVLIDFAALTRDYPQATEFVIRLRSFWYHAGYDPANGTDGKFTIEFATYLGGIMTQSGTDFVNAGGTARQNIAIQRQSFTNSVVADVDGDDMATLVYTVATKQAAIVPASTPPMPTTNAQTQPASLTVRSSASK